MSLLLEPKSIGWPAQPQCPAEPNEALFGPGALVWSGAQKSIVTQRGVRRVGAEATANAPGTGKLGRYGSWAAASGDGLRFPNWRPDITSACTCFVVAAPVSGNSNPETAFALSPDASVYGKYPSIAFIFNANYYGSPSAGQAILSVTNTATERAAWALSASIDGGVHCWAAGADSSGSYVLVDGVDQTYLGDSITGTMTRPEQQFFIGAHPTYDGARTMTSPLYLVVVVPRKMSQVEAAGISQKLLKNLGIAFRRPSERWFPGSGAAPQPYSAINIRPPSRRLRQQPKGLVQFSQAYAHPETLAFIAGRNQLLKGPNPGKAFDVPNGATAVSAAASGRTLAAASASDYLNLGILNKKATLGDTIIVAQVMVPDGASMYSVYGCRQGSLTYQEYLGLNIDPSSETLQAGTLGWFIQFNSSETLYTKITSAFVSNVPFTIVLRLNSDGNSTSVWIDGVAKTVSYVGAGGLAGGGGATPIALDLLNHNANGTHARGGAQVLMWARFNGLRIPDSQLAGLSIDPWQMFVEPTQKFTNGIVGTTYFATLSATVSTAASKILQARAIRAATTTLTAALTRAPRIVRAATTTLTASLTRTAVRVLAATTTASAAKILQAQLIKSATTTATASLATIKAQLKTLTATTTVTATKILQAQLIRSATTTLTASLARSGSRALSAATTTTAVLIKQAQLIKSATTTLTASISSIINPGVTALTLTATSTVSALLVKQAQLRRTVTSVVSAMLTRGGQSARSAVSTLNAIVIKQAQLRRTVTTTLTAVLATAKVQLLTLTATTTLTAILSYIKIALSSLPPDYGMRYAGKLIYRVAKGVANNRVVKGIMRNSVKGDK